MQNLQPGELVALEYGGAYYIYLILSKSAFFGCQWTLALYETFSTVPEFGDVKVEKGAGFVALIDFIAERRNNSVIRIGKGFDTVPFLDFDRLKALIRHPKDGALWFIYSKNFEILEKKKSLDKSELSYPVGSGMRAEQSFDLVVSKWWPGVLVTAEDSGQFPWKAANKKLQPTANAPAE